MRTLSWARGWQQDGFQPWSRVRKQVERWIIQADPELAAAHAQDAAERRHVGVGAIVDGHCDLWGRLDAADGIALDHALDAVADQLPGAERDHRRARALGVIARSALGQEPLPAASRPELLATSGGATPNRDGEVSSGATACDLTTEHERDAGTGGVRRARRADLVVHISASDALELHDGVADVDRWGPILADRLPRLLDGCRVTVRPVVDAEHLPPSESYVLPPTVWFALEQRQPVDAFPYGARRAAACDADHTIPFGEPGGRTELGNLAPLGRYAHRLKTHGGLAAQPAGPGRPGVGVASRVHLRGDTGRNREAGRSRVGPSVRVMAASGGRSDRTSVPLG